MKELFVLAWHSYAEVEDLLDAAVVGVYETLQQAQEAMKEEIEDSASYYDNEDVEVIIQDTEATMLTKNNYYIKYYINLVPFKDKLVDYDLQSEGKFKISVNDGFCEHSYKLSIPCKDSLSISDVIKGICKHFGIKVPESTLRWSIHKKL